MCKEAVGEALVHPVIRHLTINATTKDSNLTARKTCPSSLLTPEKLFQNCSKYYVSKTTALNVVVYAYWFLADAFIQSYCCSLGQRTDNMVKR